jgi:hypothetical protein
MNFQRPLHFKKRFSKILLMYMSSYDDICSYFLLVLHPKFMNGVFLQQLKLSGKKCFARGNILGCAMLLIFCQLRQIFAHLFAYIHKLHQHLHLQITPPPPLFPSLFLTFSCFLEARLFQWCQMKTECQVGC